MCECEVVFWGALATETEWESAYALEFRKWCGFFGAFNSIGSNLKRTSKTHTWLHSQIRIFHVSEIIEMNNGRNRSGSNSNRQWQNEQTEQTNKRVNEQKKKKNNINLVTHTPNNWEYYEYRNQNATNCIRILTQILYNYYYVVECIYSPIDPSLSRRRLRYVYMRVG